MAALLKKDAKFAWSNEAHKAFVTLRQAMISPLLLALPNSNDTFVIETNALGHGLGAVLSQIGHPFAFASKALPSHKKPLFAYECEFVAIIFAVKQWRSYLMGS